MGSQSVAYKKKDGSLMMATDGNSITWTPKGNGSGMSSVTIQVADITRMFFPPPFPSRSFLLGGIFLDS